MLNVIKLKPIVVFISLVLTQIASLYAQDSLFYAEFGKIHIYHPVNKPNSLMLFVSGDGGWELGVISMSKILANQGALVAGIDAKYLKTSMAKEKNACLYPAGMFEDLSMMLQKKYKFQVYQKPILVGYSFGATLVYGLLAQAPAGTFKGGIALGFCPDINITKPLCKGSGLLSHALQPGKIYYLT